MDSTQRPGVRLRIDFAPQSSLGPGKIALLEAIGRSGSLSQAAVQLGMSYRRAWGLLRDLNREFAEPVATASTGGVRGGGARLTPFATELIAAYRAVERRAAAAALARFARLVTPSAARKRGASKPLRRAVKPSRRGGRRRVKRR
jgi:molybdate transport system regulatory protein